MKTTFFYPNNPASNPQKRVISFKAGLTIKFAEEIRNTDVLEISDRLARRGIETDFKGNKVVAWCCEKTVSIFQQLNEKFGADLALPKGIYVEDFAKLNIDSPAALGFCNLRPTELKKNSNEIIPSRTLFFNSFETLPKQIPPEKKWLWDWNYINKITDFNYAIKQSATDFFLDPFFEENIHVSHEDRLLRKFGGKTLAKKLIKLKIQKK